MDNISSLVRQYKALKDEQTMIAEREKNLKTRITTLLEEVGQEDDRGSKSVDVDDVPGVAKVTWQRRVSKSLDMEAADKILLEKGLEERCIVMVPAINEQEIMAAFYEDLLTEQDVDTMYPEKVTWALVMGKS